MADRLPPGQGALQNWNNINSNKPEEYSSEFTVDGNKFANVTNVSTGQRQLYFVQPLSNQRGLLTTTNADGTITKGDKYDNFNQFNSGKLAAAETANKQASVKLLSTPGVSTPAESAAIKNSKEFKSTSVGNNAATNSPNPPSQAASPATPEQAASAASDSFKARTRKKYESLKYPENLSLETQDVIKFTILQYKPSLAGGQTEQTGRIVDLNGIVKGTTVLGSITLPIPAGINDGNVVGWSMDEMNDLQEAAGKTAALLLESQNLEAGVKPLEKLAQNITTPDGKSGISGMIANLATNANIMKRSQGATINNNQELLFGGPGLRNFSFQFSFYPRGPKEAIIVRKIIRTFKQSMSVKRSETTLLLKSPHTFAIQYMTSKDGKAVAHPYLNRFKECALTSCSVDYTPDGTYMTYSSDGDEKSMTAYRMTLQFGELEPLFDDEYGESDYDNVGF
jgi:hypothetical protein